MGKVPTNEHLDHANPHTFEIEDLKRLIKKTTADLQAADKKREEEFKVRIHLETIFLYYTRKTFGILTEIQCTIL